MTDIYFFDSYAIIEIIQGNKSYFKFTDSIIITTKLNLFEVYYSLLRDVSEEKASFFLNKYYEFAIDFDKKIIKKATKFKLEHKKRDLSMTDCIGYSIAKEYSIKFLTGDKEFKYLDNVEFVK